MAKGVFSCRHVCIRQNKRLEKASKILSGFGGKERVHNYKPREKVVQKTAVKVAARCVSLCF